MAMEDESAPSVRQKTLHFLGMIQFGGEANHGFLGEESFYCESRSWLSGPVHCCLLLLPSFSLLLLCLA